MLQETVKKLLENEQIKNQPIIASITAATTIIGIAWFMRSLQNKNRDKIPMVPYFWPIVGSTRVYNKDQLKFVKETSEKYGPVYRAHLFGKIVTIVGAGHAEEVFNHPDLNFIESQRKKFDASHFFGYIREKTPDLTIQDIIIKELNPKLKQYSPRGYMEFSSVLKESLGNTNELVSSKKLNHLILQCISQSCISIFVGPEACKETSLVSTYMAMYYEVAPEFSLSIWHQVLPWYHEKYMKSEYPKRENMKKHRLTIKKEIEKELLRFLSKGDNTDDLPESLLRFALKSHPQENNDETLESLTTFVQILFFIGVLTSVGSTIGVVMALIKNKSLLEALKQEQEEAIDDEIKEQKRLGTLSDSESVDRDEFMVKNINHIYRRMVKLDSYLREAFRHGGSSLAHSHINNSDHDVVLKSGAVIKPGEDVYINFWHVHQMNKDNIEDDLSDFKPFRHVGQGSPVTKVGENFLLFGMGKHACPGRWFAVHQMKGIITCMIRNFNITAQAEDGIQFEKKSI
ncbi:cytochrome P450 [Cunninghamella echinulata]|nr:cytochrome P450 [Cunninghamella echinulata]